MNILIFTNTYTPFVGGVEKSIAFFADQLRTLGNRVIIVAPATEGSPPDEKDVIRVPAIQNFNGTDFSVQLPIPGVLDAALKGFKPDIVHSQHPYLIGDSALRVAKANHVPIVFTFHTFYEHYTHYVPLNSPQVKRFVIALATGYCNLCDAVIAPSNSVLVELKHRGVTRPISVVPTGIDIKSFTLGNGDDFRSELGIPHDAFVAGIASRIAPEKNLGFLAKALVKFMNQNSTSHFLMIGDGPQVPEIKELFTKKKLSSRFHATGTLKGQKLIDGYHAMNVFVFASYTETQGMVLTEAMAAGIPVVALDGPGVRDVVLDKNGGKLVTEQTVDAFVLALQECIESSPHEIEKRKQLAFAAAADFSLEKCTDRLLSVYNAVLAKEIFNQEAATNPWQEARELLKADWHLLTNVAKATHEAFTHNKEATDAA